MNTLEVMRRVLTAYDTHYLLVMEAHMQDLRRAIEKAERQEPVVNIELSRRMASVKVSNFYGSIIKHAEKEIERLHGLVLQHTAPPQRQPLPAHEIVTMYEESPTSDSDMIAFARAIERKHGIGGGE
jgi:hypothetical protein